MGQLEGVLGGVVPVWALVLAVFTAALVPVAPAASLGTVAVVVVARVDVFASLVGVWTAEGSPMFGIAGQAATELVLPALAGLRRTTHLVASHVRQRRRFIDPHNPLTLA